MCIYKKTLTECYPVIKYPLSIKQQTIRSHCSHRSTNKYDTRLTDLLPNCHQIKSQTHVQQQQHQCLLVSQSRFDLFHGFARSSGGKRNIRTGGRNRIKHLALIELHVIREWNNRGRLSAWNKNFF